MDFIFQQWLYELSTEQVKVSSLYYYYLYAVPCRRIYKYYIYLVCGL